MVEARNASEKRSFHLRNLKRNKAEPEIKETTRWTTVDLTKGYLPGNNNNRTVVFVMKPGGDTLKEILSQLVFKNI